MELSCKAATGICSLAAVHRNERFARFGLICTGLNVPLPLAGSPRSLQLNIIFKHLQQNFVSLIVSMPEFLEPYQSVNADGATVRRYAIVIPDTQIQMDTSAATAASSTTTQAEAQSQQQKQGAAAKTLSSQPASGVTHAVESKDHPAAVVSSMPADSPSKQEHGSAASARSKPMHKTAPPNEATNASNALTAALPAGIKSATTYMQRRYGNGLTLCIPQPSTAPDDAPGTPGLTGTSHEAVCTFWLTMQPTDPAWDAKQLHSLELQGSLHADYPKEGSFSLQLRAEQQHIAPSACHIVNQLIGGEGRQHAGRPGALQQLLRFVDNRAGMLFHEAEDIVLEASRRGRQSGTQTQTPPGGQAPPPPPASLLDNASSSSQTDKAILDSAPPAPPPQAAPNTAAAGQQPRADAGASVGHMAGRHADADELAADFGSASLGEASHSFSDGEADMRGHESEGSWSDSQWDSSATYAGRDQQTSESDDQPGSSDEEEAPHPGYTLPLATLPCNPGCYRPLLCTCLFTYL